MKYPDIGLQGQMVLDKTFDAVNARYGDGNMPGHVASYPYHNVNHARYVMEGAVTLAHALRLSRHAIELVALSAAAHDVIRETEPNMTPEQLSAEWLSSTMKAVGYSAEERAITHGAIIATTATLDEHGVLIAKTQDIDADSEAGQIALCVASGDTRSLYAPDGPLIAHDYFRELSGLSGQETPKDLSGLREYQEGEVRLMMNYRYPHPVAEKLFARNRESIIAHHALLLRALEADAITTWRQVVELDTTYRNKSLYSR